MSQLSQETVRNALKRVVDRDSGQDVVSSDMISGVVARDGKVGFIITINPKDKERKSYLREACETEIKKLPGVVSVTAVLTAESQAQDPAAKKPAVWNKTPVEGVKNIIAVASGKGGVGKSTTTVNLALALSKAGKRVGILDADIYGPSIPRMMGLSGKPEIADGKMVPLENHGLQCMSMGFITGDEAAILRGPMITKSLNQLLRASRWDNLDYLLVDMPPGTGDIHLSLAQQAPLSGALIVTTPQDVAVIDARKCLIMFKKMDVPVLGVVENMSGPIFGEGGGEKLAQEMGVSFLGAIALDVPIREASDKGEAYQGINSNAYSNIAKNLV